MVPVQHNLCHWTQNILLDNLLYEKYCLTIFDSRFMLLKKRHGQCTSITMLHDIIISLHSTSTVQKKRCFQSYNRGYRKSGKS